VSFGYITDNRNFGYKSLNSEENYIGDKIVSESGAVFLSVLQKEPQPFEELVFKISKQFEDIDITIIKNDVENFYNLLEHEGFVVSGSTIQECNKKDEKFSYKTLDFKKTEKNIPENNNSIKKHTQDFLEEYFNGRPLLTNLHIEIISQCNERCIHCYIPHEDKISYIEPALFYDILKQAKDMNLLHLTISGGEPMLHKNFCDFLKKCREYDFSINVLSNLTLLDVNILEEMKMHSLLGVQVSLYSMNPNIHDEITQSKGSFEKTKNAILRLIENDIPLQISCPIMKQNKNCFDDVVNWAKKYNIQVGVDYAIIARNNHTTQNLSCRLSVNEIEEIISAKIEKDKKYLTQIEVEAEKKSNSTLNDFVCSVCHSSICISDNGNVYPCAGWQSFIVGNINNNSLQYIWNNSERVRYLRELRYKDFLKCLQCAEKNFCTMCMVRNANENSQGDPLIVNEYFCDIAKLNRKILFEWKKKLMNQ
jgi:radical SAM protein with 4Fe4S-binding SPASM domain